MDSVLSQVIAVLVWYVAQPFLLQESSIVSQVQSVNAKRQVFSNVRITVLPHWEEQARFFGGKNALAFLYGGNLGAWTTWSLFSGSTIRSSVAWFFLQIWCVYPATQSHLRSNKKNAVNCPLAHALFSPLLPVTLLSRTNTPFPLRTARFSANLYQAPCRFNFYFLLIFFDSQCFDFEVFTLLLLATVARSCLVLSTTRFFPSYVKLPSSHWIQVPNSSQYLYSTPVRQPYAWTS